MVQDDVVGDTQDTVVLLHGGTRVQNDLSEQQGETWWGVDRDFVSSVAITILTLIQFPKVCGDLGGISFRRGALDWGTLASGLHRLVNVGFGFGYRGASLGGAVAGFAAASGGGGGHAVQWCHFIGGDFKVVDENVVLVDRGGEVIGDAHLVIDDKGNVMGSWWERDDSRHVFFIVGTREAMVVRDACIPTIPGAGIEGSIHTSL